MLIILDNGHGGMINGVYQTKGKRSPIWDDGTQLFEGVYNREIVSILSRLLYWDGIDYEVLVEEQEDVSLKKRCERANKIYTKRRDAILISIHADAFSKESANGHTTFTSRGETKSDKYAKIINENYSKIVPEIKNRGIKEANFYILKHTYCPAILIETGFMTNEKECNFLMNNKYKIARGIFEGIKKIIQQIQ